MLRHFTIWIGAVALVASPAAVHAQVCQGGRQPNSIGILPPAESPDPPPQCIAAWINPPTMFTPYYAPMTPISTRWQVVRYVPYYPGYCKSSVSELPPGVAGHGWLFRPGPGIQPGGTVIEGHSDFNIYTGAPRDEASVLHLGGNGAYRPTAGAIDIIDALRGVPNSHP